MTDLIRFAPLYTPPKWSYEAEWTLTPFVTSTTVAVYSFRHSLPPQLLGALFSRASRAKGDLRNVLWTEYLQPILHPAEATEENLALAAELHTIIQFQHDHPKPPYNTQRAYQFFAKWLAQYGDDSIAQMTSTNLVVAGLSQPALKFLEDQRIGISPIEKSTRYVDYGAKTNGRYLYYTDPILVEWGLLEEYEQVMDALFGAYVQQIPLAIAKLQQEYPTESRSVLEKKAFDVLRGFLPMSTLSQVAFHGNAQAFKYMIDRCANHPLGELRWFAKAAKTALDEEIPSLLLRLDDQVTQEYQHELRARKARLEDFAAAELAENEPRVYKKPEVLLVEADPDGENKIIASLLFPYVDGYSWDELYLQVRIWPAEKKERLLEAHFAGRKARWQKVMRGFENTYVRFEIVMNAGAYRDLHRHRMHTQDRQRFTALHGFETLPEMIELGLADVLRQHMDAVDVLFRKITTCNKDVAQYAVTMFHFVRFYQYQNLREAFWEIELRTGSQGRPDYRSIEQQKWRLLASVYPLIAKYIQVDMNDYELARRGTEERAAAREADLKARLGNTS